MVSSALQGGMGFGGMVGQGSGVIDHDSALRHACERAPSFFRYHSRKSSPLLTQSMMKVLAPDRLLRLRRASPRTGQSMHLSALAAVQAGGCELLCSDSGRTKAQADQ